MDQTSSQHSLIGCELGHYHIVEKIGDGGMGEVFRAFDKHLGHDVALKVLSSGKDERARRSFRKEADALSRLNHPNIVTVFDFDTQENLDFLVMEYVPGIALDERAHRECVSEKEVVRIGIQLAEGLVAAHRQGVIHGDLKPGNLRLTVDGRLKILDFGLARTLQCLDPSVSTQTHAGGNEIAGTLAYMSPEQLRSETVDGRTDIYSTGAVLYELATGQPPFAEMGTPLLIDSILHGAPQPPSRVRKGISRELESIILRCLSKSPKARFQSAAELQTALQRLMRPERTRGRSIRRLGAYAAAICLLSVTLFSLFEGTKYWSNHENTRVALPVNSLAVLPFSNLSGDSTQEYLADGMTESLITDLGQIHAFPRVISFTSVMMFKSKHVALPEIARQLGVDAIVEGSVARAEKTVQITVRLINNSDTQIWSRSYQTQFRDLPTLQRELALAIADEITTNASSTRNAEMSLAPAVESEAQEAYLKGKYLAGGTSEQRLKSRQYLERAIELDPNYAAAYAGLADLYWTNIDLPPMQTMAKAKAFALKAVSLDENLARAHTALGSVRLYGDWDWQAAEREYRRALELNPNDSETRRIYAVFLSAMGRAEEAWEQLQTAQRLDPLYVDNNTTGGWILYCARQYDQALVQCQKALELAPNYDSSHACLSYAYGGRGEYDKALEESRKALELSSETLRVVLLGRNYAKAHKMAEAQKILAQLLERAHNQYVPPYLIATLYLALGDKNNSLRWIDAAYSGRDIYLVWIKVDPAVDALRLDARFRDIMERMQLASF